MQANIKHTIGRAAMLVGFFTLLSRLVGLLRDRLFASHFGAGNLLDSYYAAFRIPDLVFNLLILGTLSVAFIPVFTEYFVTDQQEAEEIANTILNLCLFAITVLCIVLYFFVPQLAAHVIAPGFQGQKLADTITLTKIFLLSPIIFTVSSVFSSILNSLKRFLLVSLAPILYNLGIIFGILFLYPRYGIKGLAYGVIVGACLHLLIQFLGALSTGYRYRLNFSLKHPGVIKIIKLFLPRIIGVDSSQISLLIASIIGSFLISGSIAEFNFANNLQAVPIGIFALSFAVACFPNLSEAYAKQDEEKFNNILSKTAVNILFFVVPLSILLILLRGQIVRVVYGSGNFNWQATRLTANTLGIMAISIFSQSLSPLFSRSFYSRQNTIIPVIVNLVTLAINAVFSYYLGRAYGVLGLALGFTIASIFDASAMYLILRTRLRNFSESYLWLSVLKIGICCVVLVFVTYSSLFIIGHFLILDRTIKVFLQGGLAGSLGLAAFMLMAYTLEMEQTSSVLRVVKRYFIR